MSAATSPLLPDYYTWGFPGAPIQIHINLDAVSALRKQFEASQKDTGNSFGLRVTRRCYSETRDHPRGGFPAFAGAGCGYR